MYFRHENAHKRSKLPESSFPVLHTRQMEVFSRFQQSDFFSKDGHAIVTISRSEGLIGAD